ncbi:C_GCAxxG_C_C family protein [Candidatus Bathyarchaeota archaeon]|nr:C_GCAxxG_C_C family protein [Candidatus Bathyarchaeota archaeon]
MIYEGRLRRNCCESTLIKINYKHQLPGFNKDILKIASNFGGGIAGWGDMCGAASAAAMAIALIYGTDGSEPQQIYEDMRLKEKKLTQEFLLSFREHWGYITCRGLLSCEGCTPDERFKRFTELNEQGLTHCGDYVDWAVKKTIEIINNQNI